MIAFTRLYMLMLINSHILTHYSCKSSKTDEKSWCECSQCHGPTAGNPYEEKKVHKTQEKKNAIFLSGVALS